MNMQRISFFLFRDGETSSSFTRPLRPKGKRKRKRKRQECGIGMEMRSGWPGSPSPTGRDPSSMRRICVRIWRLHFERWGNPRWGSRQRRLRFRKSARAPGRLMYFETRFAYYGRTVGRTYGRTKSHTKRFCRRSFRRTMVFEIFIFRLYLWRGDESSFFFTFAY